VLLTQESGAIPWENPGIGLELPTNPLFAVECKRGFVHLYDSWGQARLGWSIWLHDRLSKGFHNEPKSHTLPKGNQQHFQDGDAPEVDPPVDDEGADDLYSHKGKKHEEPDLKELNQQGNRLSYQHDTTTTSLLRLMEHTATWESVTKTIDRECPRKSG
jgi:hypothetical protein